jgi:hypothetical protein
MGRACGQAECKQEHAEDDHGAGADHQNLLSLTTSDGAKKVDRVG